MNIEERKQKREEKQKQLKEWKVKYKDHETYVDKRGYDRINFSLGEIRVPDDFKDLYLKVVPKDGKNYLLLTLNIGKNPKVKEQQLKERKAKTEKVLKERVNLKIKVRECKLKLKDAIKTGKTDVVTTLMTEKKQLEQQLADTKLRSK